jgi:hypothetical protein
MSTTIPRAGETEASILARVLAKGDGQFPEDLARHILDRGFSDRDKARMHDLAVRNQDGTLSPAEQDELFAFVKAGDLLSILQSRARRALGITPRNRKTS